MSDKPRCPLCEQAVFSPPFVGLLACQHCGAAFVSTPTTTYATEAVGRLSPWAGDELRNSPVTRFVGAHGYLSPRAAACQFIGYFAGDFCEPRSVQLEPVDVVKQAAEMAVVEGIKPGSLRLRKWVTQRCVFRGGMTDRVVDEISKAMQEVGR